MDSGDLKSLLDKEIRELHDTFEAWFRGELDSLERVESVLADEFTFISPRGDLIGRQELLTGLRRRQGSRDIRIRTGDVELHLADGPLVVTSYKEWHDHADYSTARHTSAVLRRNDSAPAGLRWLHVHETWITPPPTWVVPERAG